jgi:hypothetical protein
MTNTEHNFNILNKFIIEVFIPILKNKINALPCGDLSGFISINLCELINIVNNDLYKDAFPFIIPNIHDSLYKIIVKYILFQSNNTSLIHDISYFVLPSEELVVNMYVINNVRNNVRNTIYTNEPEYKLTGKGAY